MSSRKSQPYIIYYKVFSTIKFLQREYKADITGKYMLQLKNYYYQRIYVFT